MPTETNLEYLENFYGSEKLNKFIENNYGHYLSSQKIEYLFEKYDDYDLLKLNGLMLTYKVIRGHLEDKFGYKKIKHHLFKVFITKLMEKVEPDEKIHCRKFIVGIINIHLKKLQEHYSIKLTESSNKNKEKSKEYATSKITCDCGCIVSKGNIAKHKRSPKHLTFLENSKDII